MKKRLMCFCAKVKGARCQGGLWVPKGAEVRILCFFTVIEMLRHSA